MEEPTHSVYLQQLKAMLIRNILIKKKEKRKTLTVSTRLIYKTARSPTKRIQFVIAFN